jgi:hypothetical protein
MSLDPFVKPAFVVMHLIPFFFAKRNAPNPWIAKEIDQVL